MQDAAKTQTSATVASNSSTGSLSKTSTVDEGRFVPGTLIAGRYRIISLLGRGGMGEVYRATDLTLGQAVALKFLPDTGGPGFERLLERFQNEVRVARQVSHPNVCRVYDLGEFEGMPYMSMEYVDGEDLSGLLSRIGRLPSDKALDIARKLCAGLAAAHDKGVIHRDLKPANIMLDKRGNAVIMDFGLAAVANELRGAEARSGSPAYQAPEQLRGEEVTAKSDIYALGLVLYELFTGKRVYDAKSIQDLIKAQESAQIPAMASIAADVDPAVEKVIQKCLAPIPAQRPGSALSIAAQLPGGDPLAAALAAGEMPSPELVAASGKKEGLALKYSAPLAAALIACCIATPFLRKDIEIHSLIPSDLPPQALAVRAHDFARQFGYTDPPIDSQHSTVWRWDVISAANNATTNPDSNPGIGTLRQRFSAESPLLFSYRQSPNPLITSDGAITERQPSPLTSGMVHVMLTSSGELRKFTAVPPQTDGAGAASPIDIAALSKATGIDLAQFQPAVPTITPLYAFDWQAAWKGRHPNLDLDIAVEAAAWHGKLTHLTVRFPWSQPDRMPGARGNFRSQLIDSMLTALIFCLSLFFAARNLRAGLGDIRGATQITALIFSLRVLAWICTAHWTMDIAFLGIFADMVGGAFARACIIWLLYIALEPNVRGRWPGVLISWNRILQGRGNDPLVATRALQGTAIGFLILAFLFADNLRSAHRGQISVNTDALTGVGLGMFIAPLAIMLKDAIEFGLGLILGLSFLRTIFKKDWLACLALAVITALWEKRDEPTPVAIVGFVLIFFVLALFLLRLGLTATTTSIFMLNLLSHTPGAQNLTKWYEWTVFAFPLTAIAIIGWAFWQCSGEEAMTIKPHET